MNILITGTPGCGKTTFCESLIQEFNSSPLLSKSHSILHHNISLLVKEKKLYESFDNKFQSHIVDDDKILDFMEEQLNFNDRSRVPNTINLIDYHDCSLFPESWIDLVVVLTTDNTTIYDRLVGRGYSDLKISENVTCEIMQVVLSEARESFDERIIVVLESFTPQDMQKNVEIVLEKINEQLKNE